MHPIHSKELLVTSLPLKSLHASTLAVVKVRGFFFLHKLLENILQFNSAFLLFPLLIIMPLGTTMNTVTPLQLFPSSFLGLKKPQLFVILLMPPSFISMR